MFYESSEVVPVADFGLKNVKRSLCARFCGDRMILCNLMLMAVLWCVTTLNYYMIAFMLKYIPGNVYINNSVATISELIATVAGGVLVSYTGGKVAFIISFSISAVGSFLLVFVPASNVYLIAFFVLLAKFGISFAFLLVYLMTSQLFPTDLTASAFGICNIFANLTTIISPMLAEAKGDVPMLVFGCMCVLGGFLTLFLNTNVKYD